MTVQIEIVDYVEHKLAKKSVAYGLGNRPRFCEASHVFGATER